MSISIAVFRAPRVSLVTVLGAGLVFVGAARLLGGDPLRSTGPECADAVTDCEVANTVSMTAASTARPPILSAGEACRNVGYLCAALSDEETVRVMRWRDFNGTLVVYVPRPDFEDAVIAADLQRAAAAGIRAWSGQPFQILTDLRGDREPHFSVRWTPELTGNRIGLAGTRWSAESGLRVVSVELVTRNPYDRSRVIEPRQIQLTAAHEMGHALGLPHSDAPRDVMYPTNTATSLSAQDYRTMEALYELQDGTEIVR